MNKQNDDDAVSEVFGTILLLVISVGLIGSVYIMFNGVTDQNLAMAQTVQACTEYIEAVLGKLKDNNLINETDTIDELIDRNSDDGGFTDSAPPDLSDDTFNLLTEINASNSNISFNPSNHYIVIHTTGSLSGYNIIILNGDEEPPHPPADEDPGLPPPLMP